MSTALVVIIVVDQLRDGVDAIDQRADVFALGVILREVAAGAADSAAVPPRPRGPAPPGLAVRGGRIDDGRSDRSGDGPADGFGRATAGGGR